MIEVRSCHALCHVLRDVLCHARDGARELVGLTGDLGAALAVGLGEGG